MSKDHPGVTEHPGSITPKLTLDTTDFTSKIADADKLAKRFSSSLTSAFVDVALKGKSLGDVINGIGLSLSKMALTTALKPLEQGFTDLMKPLTEGFASLVTGLGKTALSVPNIAAATGAPMPILPFADGGVIAAPTYFPLGSGLGLAGEAGAEAILPLARGADGGLGVRMQGASGAPVAVTFNVTTPDVEGFRRSEAEITAQLARAVGRGQRGL